MEINQLNISKMKFNIIINIVFSLNAGRKIKLKKVFVAAAPHLWDDLPDNIKCASSL